MRKSSSVIDAAAERLKLSVTALARLARIDVGDLHDVSNGRTCLTEKMLERLLDVSEMDLEMKSRLTQAYCEDRLPDNARAFVRITRSPAAHVPLTADAGSTLDRELTELGEIARCNPAVAHALRNILRVIKGEQVAL